MEYVINAGKNSTGDVRGWITSERINATTHAEAIEEAQRIWNEREERRIKNGSTNTLDFFNLAYLNDGECAISSDADGFVKSNYKTLKAFI